MISAKQLYVEKTTGITIYGIQCVRGIQDSPFDDPKGDYMSHLHISHLHLTWRSVAVCLPEASPAQITFPRFGTAGAPPAWRWSAARHFSEGIKGTLKTSRDSWLTWEAQ